MDVIKYGREIRNEAKREYIRCLYASQSIKRLLEANNDSTKHDLVIILIEHTWTVRGTWLTQYTYNDASISLCN